jgi:hypothetical protein
VAGSTPTPALGSAVKPKPLSATVKKGLEYLVKHQDQSGGWGQGGGWRVAGQGGRVEGPQVQDPPDIGNTCAAVLALVRAGNTPKEGPYARHVARAVDFICRHVEKADDQSLYVTDVQGTQIQSKIGPYVDTFLTALVLAELKGKMPDDKSERRMVAALNKTLKKMEKHQKNDGTFAGNQGWAPVLSQGLANKGLARASQMGLAVPESAIKRVEDQVAASYDAQARTFRGGPVGASLALPAAGAVAARAAEPVRAGGIAVTRTVPAAVSAPTLGDAGVPIYTASSYLTNSADVTNSYRQTEQKARAVLDRKDASREEKDKARATLRDVAKADDLRAEATRSVLRQLNEPSFVQGFGSNGGEEFLSFMNISEALLLKGGADWMKWDKAMSDSLTRIQDQDGSWSGQHCITGKTFCTATALLVLMADRAPVPVVKTTPGK